MELKDFIKATQHTHVGSALICDVTKKACFAKSEGCERDCGRLQNQMDDDDPRTFPIYHSNQRERS